MAGVTGMGGEEDELFPMTIELHPREHIISLKIANLDIYLSYEAGVGSLLPRGKMEFYFPLHIWNKKLKKKKILPALDT